jgi:hypothetical protein
MPENKFPFIHPVSCIKCGKELKSLESDSYDMVDSGVVGKLYAPFGSVNDGTVYQIGICDDCIKSSNLKPIGDYISVDMDTEIKLKKEISHEAVQGL